MNKFKTSTVLSVYTNYGSQDKDKFNSSDQSESQRYVVTRVDKVLNFTTMYPA